MFFLLPVGLFINLDCFGVCCPMLKISPVEMSDFSQMALGTSIFFLSRNHDPIINSQTWFGAVSYRNYFLFTKLHPPIVLDTHGQEACPPWLTLTVAK